MAFKRFFLPVESEEEFKEFEAGGGGAVYGDFKELVKTAIKDGAALPDTGRYSSEQFLNVAKKERCGKGARTRLRTVLGMEFNTSTHLYGGLMPAFHLHAVLGEGGYGNFGISNREVGGFKVRQVERVFQQELGSLDQYSPWMDIHVALWDNDLDAYAHKLLNYGASVLALRWPAIGLPADQPSLFYSLIFNTPDTQEILEIISATEPSDPRLVLREFPMTRHVFYSSDLSPLTGSTGATPLHISRSHYDLDAVKEHYWKFFQMKPVFEERNADTGVSFVSFWHQSPLAETEGFSAETVHLQVMYWNRPDQSMTVGHTTEWLERKLESLNSEYLRSSTCWPVWGDNHYTIPGAPAAYWNSVKDAYDAAGIGYKVFRKENVVFTGYFPLPGGMYLELERLAGDPVYADPDVELWPPDYNVTPSRARRETAVRLRAAAFSGCQLVCFLVAKGPPPPSSYFLLVPLSLSVSVSGG